MGKTLPENSSRNFITVLRAARTSKSRYLQNTRDCKYTTANSEDHRLLSSTTRVSLLLEFP